MSTYKLLCCYVFTTITATAAYAQSAPDCWTAGGSPRDLKTIVFSTAWAFTWWLLR